MRRVSPWLTPLLPLLVSGCGLLPIPSPQSSPSPPFSEARIDPNQVSRLQAKARILRYDGRYREALDRLQAALALHPGDPALAEEKRQTEAAWRRVEQELNDHLLTINVEAQRRRLPVLQQLARANPDDRATRMALEQLHSDLQGAATALAACHQRQATSNPVLATRCQRLAQGKATPHRPARKQVAKNQPRPPSPAAAKAPQPMPSPPEDELPQLVKARELIRAGNHFGAIRYLEKLEKQGVDSLEARALLQQARTELAQNTDTLLATGDSLYREGKVKEALALWQAALAINPFDATARKKSERAMRVLANMDALREEKPPEARPNKAL